MSMPYDAANKGIYDLNPANWAGSLGIKESVRITDSDLSTISAAADKVLIVEANPEYILHTEFQAQYDPYAPEKTMGRAGLLLKKHKMPVASVVVLLAKKASGKKITGSYRVKPGFGPAWTCRYTVVKIWELPVEKFLTGPITLLPLAPIAKVNKSEVPGVLSQLTARLRAEADDDTAGKLWTAVGILLQLRYGQMTSQDLLAKYPEASQFEIFQTFRGKDRADAKREVILELASEKFGSPNQDHLAALNDTVDVERLRILSKRILKVNSWDDLLGHRGE